jgi:CRP-like cAMP-binding protein
MNASVEQLAKHPFLRGVAKSHLAALVPLATVESFAAGTELLREGDEATAFFLLQSGRVLLETHTPGGPPIPIQTLGSGDALGISWMFSPAIWHFTGRAIEPTVALRFDARRLKLACERDSELGFALLLRLGATMQQRLNATRLQLIDLYAPRG